MCSINIQIMEAEEKLANAQTEGEKQVLRHELERLDRDLLHNAEAARTEPQNV